MAQVEQLSVGVDGSGSLLSVHRGQLTINLDLLLSTSLVSRLCPHLLSPYLLCAAVHLVTPAHHGHHHCSLPTAHCPLPTRSCQSLCSLPVLCLLRLSYLPCLPLPFPAMSSSPFALSFRPLGDMLDVNAFKVPAAEDALARVQTNVSYYALNYAAVFGLGLLVLSLQHPTLLFASLSIAAGGWYLLQMRTSPVVLGGVRLSEDQVKLLYLAVSTLLFLYAGGWSILYTASVCALLVLLHAGLRQRSVKARGSAFVQAAKDSVRREVNDVRQQLSSAGGGGSGSASPRSR